MKLINSSILFLACALSCACTKQNDHAGTSVPDRQIVFRTSVPEVIVGTKAGVNEVTESNLDNIAVMATTGAAGSETQVWNTWIEKSGSDFHSGKYWPLENPGYHFYAANSSLVIDPSWEVILDRSEQLPVDIVCATVWSPVFFSMDPALYRGENLAFEHVMARIGTISASSSKGYSISGLTVRISDYCYEADYHLRTGEWVYDYRSDSKTLLVNADGSSRNNNTTANNGGAILPGTWEITASFQLRKGDFSNQYTKTGTVNLAKGKITSIVIDISIDDAVECTFNTSVSPWTGADLPLTVE